MLLLIQTNCNDSRRGQVINAHVCINERIFISKLKPQDCIETSIGGHDAYWDSRRQLFSYAGVVDLDKFEELSRQELNAILERNE